MNNQSSNDSNENQQQSLPNQRPARSELLRKIYYPDTLYPDGYTFFADRRTRLLTDTNESTGTTTIPKQSTIEIEMTERQSKYSVSVVCTLK